MISTLESLKIQPVSSSDHTAVKMLVLNTATQVNH